MLENLLKPNTGASLSGCVRWAQPAAGVRVCDFDCALTVPPTLPAPPAKPQCEVLFCRQGGLRLTMDDGRQVVLREHEILLLCGGAVQHIAVADGVFGGELVAVEREAAALPHTLRVNAAQLKARLYPHCGCVVLRSAAWIETLFAALLTVPEQERVEYSVLKAAELLYLIAGGSPLLPHYLRRLTASMEKTVRGLRQGGDAEKLAYYETALRELRELEAEYGQSL